eukprot:CAMPEP_0172479226 /NCGR_PEP_ID=MMETSP1066-20121228/3690_1 /TAXON_ID=671091 /ORGANISM="Coscinodiscus wailesii, Strain CCMP2513" /LENGTH=79 /DNA_ID=CAMNT_0013239509 /DNA_START=398 /DNA_END=637 /DNA_ORIENTATION=-
MPALGHMPDNSDDDYLPPLAMRDDMSSVGDESDDNTEFDNMNNDKWEAPVEDAADVLEDLSFLHSLKDASDDEVSPGVC